MPISAISGGAPTNPALPALPNYGGGAGQDRANINQLLSGQFDPYEYNMASAEKALGTGGGGFAGAQRLKLLDSEKLMRQQLGHQELDPYLQREQQTALQSQAERAQAANIAQEGALALQRLQISEAGQGARLTQEEKANLERQILSGNQAMAQLQVQQSGENSRQRVGIGGQLANTLLSQSGAGRSGGGLPAYNQGKYGGQAYNYTTDYNGGSTYGTPPPADYWNSAGSGGGGGIRNSVVQRILQQYGIR